MHHGDRTPPIALARQAPVAQPVLGYAHAPARGLGKLNCGIDRLLSSGNIKPGKMVNPNDFFSFWRHKGQCVNWRVIGHRKEGVDYRQIVFAAKVKVALIMCGAGKDRACAVIHQNEIGHPDGQFPVGVERMPNF